MQKKYKKSGCVLKVLNC